MTTPEHLRYSKSHEWARLDDDGNCCVGITHHAQDQLGDIVYFEPPEVGRVVAAGQECAVLESVKAAADIYAPIGGEVIEVNHAVASTPELINQDAYSAWLFKLKPTDAGELRNLLSATQYQAEVDAAA
jgi:glycine cleavage system H protein